MATFVEFEVFSEDLANKIHDLNSDTFKWYLTNTAPTASGDSVKADLPTEISAANGYSAGGFGATLSFSRSGGQTTVSLASNSDLTSSTGNVGPFRYACLYNDTSASDSLVGYLDHGSSITLDGTVGDIYRIPAGTLFTIN